MGIGSFLKDVGHGAASLVHEASSGLNTVDRYINPFHVEEGSTVTGDTSGNSFLGNAVVQHLVSPTVEDVSNKIRWVYNNGISQPISTALLAGDLPGGPFSAHNWAVAWHAANHISMGQAFFLGSGENNPYSAVKAVNSPLAYAKPQAAYLPPDFNSWSEDQQQEFLEKAGMPAIGNRYIEELRQTNSMFKNASGVADFAMNWYADPAILAGKVLGASRAARQITRRPAAGWSTGDINKIMDSSPMGKAIDFIYANRGNPALLNNLQMVRNSALGPRFGSIASTLRSPAEVHEFLRVGLGDVNAIERLQSQNAMAAARIEQDTSRLSALDLMHTRYSQVGDQRMTTLAVNQMKDLQDRINADEDLVRSYNNVLDHAHEIDAVNLTRWNSASLLRAQARTDAQAAYRASTARGAKAGAMGRQVTVTPTPPIFSAGTATPVDLGFVKTRLYGLGDYFSSPVTFVRSFGNVRPNGYVRLDDIDNSSIAEVRAQIARIPGIDSQVRLNMLNEYLGAKTEGDRLGVLTQIGATGAAKVAEKHGLDPQVGADIYQQHLKKQFGEIDNMKRYSAAQTPAQLPDGSFARVHVDEFTTDGGKLVIHPNLVTKLVNDHVFQDLDELDKVLGRHSSAIRAIRTSTGATTDWMLNFADGLNHLWKFGTLFRLGYIPRVAGDDLAGQVARLGAASMAMRAGWGVRNGATNVALRMARPFAAAKAATAKEGVDYAQQAMDDLQSTIKPLQTQITAHEAANAAGLRQAQRRLAAAQTKRAAMDPATTPPAKVAAMDTLITRHQAAVDRATSAVNTGAVGKRARLDDLQQHYSWLDDQRAAAQRRVDNALKVVNAPKAIQGMRPVVLPGGVQAPGAFEGEQGAYYQKLVSSDEAVGQIFQSNKALVHGHLMRSFDHGAKPITAANDEELHAQSWAHAINAQLMQDPLAVQRVRGASVDTMTKWLTSSAEGRDYLRRLGLAPSAKALQKPGERIIKDPADVANRAAAEVDEYMPIPEIRDAALAGEVTPDFLKSSMPMAHRPEVHTGQVGVATAAHQRAIDSVIDRFYKVAATMPADRWSRHPLFNQLYEGHLKTLASQLKKQGAYDTSVGAVEDMAKTARRLALRDTRGLVFDIAHRSDVAAALRLISPFMAATTESFQRWGRIIAERPQVVGYAARFYNAPAATGNMQDADGNNIDRNGYSYTIDPTTGKAVKTLVPKSQRYIVGRMPKWLVHTTGGKLSPFALAFGIEPSSRNFKLSQNSIDLVTQGDPWWNPGVGPVVQIPTNELVKDKPRAAELARQLQVLPFGPQNGGPFGTGPAGEAASFVLPSTVKNFLTAYDTSDSRYQAIKLQIMQRAAFEHDQLGKPMPSPAQIAKMTRNYWLFSAASAFMQPMATSKQDNFQFFRDQYNALRRQNPLTADDQFLDRFGEAYFVFAQSQSQNNTGIPATQRAVELEKQYGDLIARNPELGALIVGPEGSGPFSPEAYSYQLNTPVTPGSSEMQRTKMSADQAMQENNRRLGWAKYTAMVNRLTAELHNRGLNSFSDKGAEDLKREKTAYTALWSQPLMPDGTPNPYYNDAWSRDYSSFDNLKYERLIPGLTEVANSALAQNSNRSDLRVLQQYLGGRKAVVQLLQQRSAAGGSKTLTAKSNADLLGAWQRFVDGLIESNTNFGDLHSRYLARDLGADLGTQQDQPQQLVAAA
jgi:hypothetical protein